MAYGLNLSKFSDEEYDTDEFGNPIRKKSIPRFSTLVSEQSVTDSTKNNPYINKGRPATEIVNTGYVPPIINQETQKPSYRGLDFDFTTAMPELAAKPSVKTMSEPSPITPAETKVSDSEFIQDVAGTKKKSSFVDWWKDMDEDKRTALTRGVLATGLNMMSLGGRTYDRPVSALGLMGEAGKAGLSQYEDTYERDRTYNIRKGYYDLAKEGLKLKSDVYKSRMSDMSDTDKTLFKDAQSEQSAMIKQFSPMLGDSLAALDPANFLSEINNNPTVREIVEKNIKKNPASLDKWNRLESIISQRFGMKVGTGLNLSDEAATQTKKEWELYE